MSSKLQPLTGTRQDGETAKAVQACNDYMRMGPGRSLAKLSQFYHKAAADPKIKAKVPSKHKTTLSKWSRTWGWVDRAEEFDSTILEEEKNQRAKEARETGYALDYERIKTLKDLAGHIWEDLESGVYTTRLIKVGQGEDAELIPVEVYNKEPIADLRGLLDDLAKETGGRISKHQIEQLDIIVNRKKIEENE